MDNDAIGLYDLDIKDDESILSFTKGLWDNKDQLVGGLHQRWLDTISCYMGFYHLDFDRALKQFQDRTQDMPSWRVNLAINLLLPRTRTQVAKLLKTRPIFDVIPNTLDTADIEIAAQGKKTLQGLWYKKDYNFKFIDMLYWLVLTGNVYLMPYWDPFSGPFHEMKVNDFLNLQEIQAAVQSQDPVNIELVLAEAKKKLASFQKTNGEGVFLGDVGMKVVNPFNVLHSDSDEFESIDWLIYAQIRDRSYYKQIDVKTEEFEKPSDKDKRLKNLYHYTNMLSAFDGLGFSGNSHSDKYSDDVLELQLRLPRSETHKRGFFAVIAGGKVIYKGPNPYKHQDVGFVHFFAEKIPGKIDGMSAAEHAIPPIRSYNKTLSKLHEQFNLMSQPKWLVPNTSGITVNKITSKPAQVLRYSGSAPPTVARMPEPSAMYEELMGHDIRNIDEITSQRESSRGINPSGGRSAALAKNLQSVDEGSLAILGLVLDTGLSKTGRLILSIVNQFYTEDRLIAFVGDRNRHVSFTYKQGSLTGKNEEAFGADYFHVRVTTYTQFGLDRSGQETVLKDFLQHGVFGPQDRAKILKWLDMGWFEDEIDEFKTDRSVAHRENLAMAQGQPAVPTDEQHHLTHIDEHRTYLNSDEGRKLDIKIQEMIRRHMYMTKLLMVKQTVEPQMMQMAAQALIASDFKKNLGIDLGEMLNNGGSTQQSGSVPSGNSQSDRGS